MPVSACITLAEFDMLKFLHARNSLGLSTSIFEHTNGQLRLEYNQAQEPDWEGVIALSAWAARTDPLDVHRQAFVVKTWNERMPGVIALKL